jgi:hypothetical protein
LLNNTSPLQAIAMTNNKNDDNYDGEDRGGDDLRRMADLYMQSNDTNQLLLQPNNQEASSSIDNLLESFFTKNFSTDASRSNKIAENQILTTLPEHIKFNLNDTEMEIDTELNNMKQNLSKSDSICIKDLKDHRNLSDEAAFSLKDLASQYLSSNSMKASSFGSSTTSMGVTVTSANDTATSLQDMIDNELNVGQNMHSITNKSSSVDAIDFFNTEMENKLILIELNKEDLLKRKEKQQQSPSQNLVTTAKFRSNETNELEMNAKILKLLSPLNHSSKGLTKQLENMFTFDEENSVFSIYLVNGDNQKEMLQNNSNDVFEDMFSYSKQVEFNADIKKANALKTKPIDYFIEADSTRVENKTKSTDKQKITSKKSSSSSTHAKEANDRTSLSPVSSKLINRSLNKSSSAMLKSKNTPLSSSSSSSSLKSKTNIKAFDFSIPSPDDVVIAKQKFAFRNMRFK